MFGNKGEGLLHACISSISGDRALASRQSKKCPQKHGGFWPNLRHFDVIIIRIFMVKTTDKLKCGE